MGRVSLLIDNLPIVTARSRTIPTLGVVSLSDLWGGMAQAVYRGQGDFFTANSLSESELLRQLVGQVDLNYLSGQGVMTPTIHLVALSDEPMVWQTLQPFISRRLPHTRLVNHPLDIFSAANWQSLFSDNKQAVKEHDLVVTTIPQLLNVYPQAKLITKQTRQIPKSLLITNHTSSYDSAQGLFSDDYYVDDWSKLHSLVNDELTGEAYREIGVLLDKNKLQTEDQERELEGLVADLKSGQHEMLLLGLPNKEEARWYPVGLSQGSSSRSHLESATENFGLAEAKEAWQHFHQPKKAVPKMWPWLA